MYRLLNEGEPINEGDEIYTIYKQMEEDTWHKLDNRLIGTKAGRIPIRRDMDKWKDGIPPIGAKVDYAGEPWVVIETIFAAYTGKMTIIIYSATTNDYAERKLVNLENIKPWSEDA